MFYSAPVGERSIAISLSICLSLPVYLYVCLSASISLEPLDRPSRKCCVPCGRGSVLLWRRCDTLCASGFKDDVTFGPAVVGLVAMHGLYLVSRSI